MISSRSNWQVSVYSLPYQRSQISHRICCLMKTLQKSLSSTQLLTALSSTLEKKNEKKIPNKYQRSANILQSYIFFFMAMLMHLFIQTLELLNETYFLNWWWWYQLVIYNCDHNSYHIDFYNSIIKFLETSEIHVLYRQYHKKSKVITARFVPFKFKNFMYNSFWTTFGKR